MAAGHCDCGRFLVESFALLLHSTSPLFLWKLELRAEHFRAFLLSIPGLNS